MAEHYQPVIYDPVNGFKECCEAVDELLKKTMMTMDECIAWLEEERAKPSAVNSKPGDQLKLFPKG